MIHCSAPNSSHVLARLVLPILSVISTLALPLGASGAPSIELTGYQLPNGAITVFQAGDTVDPYFATKALLSARQAGADISNPAQNWISWLLAQQHRDGTFSRYCLKDGKFVECADADADDALLAVWIELLVKSAPSQGMPLPWSRSLESASKHLLTLKNHRTGVYHISTSLPVALFMDNVEVHSALRALSEWHFSQGNRGTAKRWKKRMRELTAAIQRVFRLPNGEYRASIQNPPSNDFYPDRVAQLYPILGEMDGFDIRTHYQHWLAETQSAWFAQPEHDYPWALAALAAHLANDRLTVACWCTHAQFYRQQGAHWNVLEEVLFQTLSANVQGLLPRSCASEPLG